MSNLTISVLRLVSKVQNVDGYQNRFKKLFKNLLSKTPVPTLRSIKRTPKTVPSLENVHPHSSQKRDIFCLHLPLLHKCITVILW